MFALVITLISILLVAALVLATLYFGGSSYANSTQTARALTVVNQGQQILGAMELFKVHEGRYPGQPGLDGIVEMVNEGYLNAVPTVSADAAAHGIPTAYAAEATWVVPVPGVPTAIVQTSVQIELCREVNMKVRGDNGILAKAYTMLGTQCFGPRDSALTVIVTKGGEGLAPVVGEENVVTGAPPASQGSGTEGGSPGANDGDGTWLLAPATGKGSTTTPQPPAPRPGEPRFSSESVDFGAVRVGQSQHRNVRLTNVGGSALSLEAPGLTGAGFGISSGCGNSLAANAFCDTTITFAPASMGSSDGSLVIATGAGPVSVALRGLGTQVVGGISSEGGAGFGTVAINASAVKSFTFTNAGNEAATGVYAAVTGANVVLASNSCGTSNTPVVVEAGQSCDITARWTPTALGPLADASLTIVADASTLSSVTLAGTAVGRPSLGVSPAPLTFGSVLVGNTSTKSMTLSNTGTRALTFRQAAVLSGDNQFKLTNSTCGASLNPGENCVLTIKFTPTTNGLTANTVVTTFSDAENNTNTVDATYAVGVSGTAVGAVGELTANSSTDFGTQTAGFTSSTRVFTFRNTGGAEATGVYAMLNGVGLIFITGTTCGYVDSPTTLAPNATCTITVSYSPSGAGTLTNATLQVISSAVNSASSLALTGTARASGYVRAGNVYWVYGGTMAIDYPGAVATCAAGNWGGATGWRLASKPDFDNLMAAGLGGAANFTAAGWPTGVPAGTASKYWTTSQYQLTANVWMYTSTNNGFTNSPKTAGYSNGNTLCVHD